MFFLVFECYFEIQNCLLCSARNNNDNTKEQNKILQTSTVFEVALLTIGSESIVNFCTDDQY